MRKIFNSPLLILALGLGALIFSTVGATRAAINIRTAEQRVNFSTATFSVDVQELIEDEFVSVDDGKLKLPEFERNEAGELKGIQVGRNYGEYVQIANNSNPETGYAEYVRVVVRKSWYKNGKQTYLNPDFIELDVNEDEWYRNPAESTFEQEVYYRKSPLACGETEEFLRGIKIKDSVTEVVSEKNIEGEIETEYVYNGEYAYIQIEADAVQTHNAEAAIYGAWGIEATCSAADDGDIVTISGAPVE